MLQVDYLVLADAVTLADSKLYIHGAGWNTIAAAGFPATHLQIGVALRLRVPWNDTNHPYTIELDVVDEDERSILPQPNTLPRGSFTMGRPANAIEGEDQVVPLAFSLVGLQFPRTGTYAVVVRIDGEMAARSKFNLVPMPGSTAG